MPLTTNPYAQGGKTLDDKLKLRAGAVQRAAGPAQGVSTTGTATGTIVKTAGPAAGVTYEPPKTDPVVVRPNATLVPKEEKPVTAPPPVKTAFDLQREQVTADQMAEEKRREAAVERYFSNRGLGDSGILQGAERAERAAVAAEAGRQRSQIAQEESRQAFAAGEAAKDRTATREMFDANLKQARELAYAGLDLQKSSLALQEKGMKAEDARFYAGLAQADKHAQQGLTLEEARLDLQKQGMTQQEAQFVASLGQARYLAERGFDLEASRVELARLGMTDENARFFAGLAHQKEMLNLQESADVRRGILADSITKIDPKDPEYFTKINALVSMFPDLNVRLNATAAPNLGAKKASSGSSGVLDSSSTLQDLKKLGDAADAFASGDYTGAATEAAGAIARLGIDPLADQAKAAASVGKKVKDFFGW